MKATIEFLRQRFDRYNKEIFGLQLPVPEMRITSARSFMGQFKSERKGGWIKGGETIYYITLSNRYDLEEKELEDILIHEMIHFFISVKKIKDTSSHGHQFRALMNEINRRHGRNITVSHRCTRQQLDSDDSKSHSIVCLCEMTDGRKLVCRASQSRVFELHRAFSDWDKVASEQWYWVYGSYFNRYSRVLNPKLFPVDEEGLKVIESGTRLEFAELSGGRTILRPAGGINRLKPF